MSLERSAQTMRCQVVPWMQGSWGGLCMGTIWNVMCESTAVTMTVVQVYNRCIGTMAESPKKGMRMDGTGIQETTEM